MNPTQILPALAAGVALLLAGCDSAGQRSADVAAEPARLAPDGPPPAERVQPIRWNETEERFELNGQPLKAAKLWTFDDSTEGFVVAGGEAGLTSGSGLSVILQQPDPILRTPSGLNVDGSVNTLVLVRLTRAAPGDLWSGAVHYTTEGHGESADYIAMPIQGADPAVNETTILVYDMSKLKRGGDDWTRSVIDQIRFDFEDAPGGEFLVRQVAIARDPAAPAAAEG
ncbi:MAG: hypothetical protein ACK4YQ_06525 [Phenylobacterium sp.]|uniref:hypothetical protein n=1 Tax=Phenylobacterium sp. TaxID=1871053 RepID=UPI0039188CFF